MKYKTIFAYLPSSKSAPLLAELSADIAAQCEGHLIGAHNSARLMIYGGIPADYLAQYNQNQREEADRVEQAFQQAAKARSISHEWRHRALPDTDAFEDIVAAAGAAELIVAGGRGEEDPLGQWYDLPIRLVLETGRPVMLIPTEYEGGTVGQRVTVAWNHSREAARAAFDALPLLTMAENVRILSINSTKGSTEGPCDELVATLRRQGVNAEAAAVTTTDHWETDELMADLTRSNSDLLVMGCYGHSRLREMVLGGVTKHILAHAKIPVLMSH